MNIYVGNISRTATEQDLRDAFAAFAARLLRQPDIWNDQVIFVYAGDL